MFLDFAKSKSTLSMPTPHLAIIFSCSASSKTSLVNFVALRITTISLSFIWLAKSSSFDADLDMSKQSPIVSSSL